MIGPPALRLWNEETLRAWAGEPRRDAPQSDVPPENGAKPPPQESVVAGEGGKPIRVIRGEAARDVLFGRAGRP